MDDGRATFGKRERLVSRKLMEQLFGGSRSRSMAAFPVRVVYKMYDRQEGMPLTQMMVSVSKRHFKRAVHRNRAKRQIREAYRLNKQLLTGQIPADKTVSVAFIWLADTPVDSKRVEHSVVNLLKRMAEKLQ